MGSFCLVVGFSLFWWFFTKLLVTSRARDTEEGEKRVLGGQNEGKKPLERSRRIGVLISP